MTVEEGIDEIAAPSPRRRWVLRAFLLLLFLLLLGVLVLWWQRRAIADDVLRRELVRQGVAARYHVADIGLARQRIENLVIGDPAHPDLVADWVEVNTSLGFGTAEVTGVRAGQVRLQGRLVDGKLSLGELDKLMPASSAKPFALPALFVDVADARMRLETPQGVVGLKVSGRGRLDDGFSGRLAAVSERIDAGGCVLDRVATYLSVSIADTQPKLSGPLRAARAACAGTVVTAPNVVLDTRLDGRLDRWQGTAQLAAARLARADMAAEALTGTIDFDGGAAATKGTIELATGRFAALDRRGSALTISGAYRVGSQGNGFDGTVSARSVSLAAADRRAIGSLRGAASGTPVAPLAGRLADALQRAGEGFDLEARLTAALTGQGGGALNIERLSATSASGAVATLSGGNGVRYGWPATGLTLDGLLTLSGGGLPGAVVHLAQAGPGRPVTGDALIQPYAADGARLALTPVSFSAGGGSITRISTRATLSGPMASGRVDDLTAPIDARWNGAGVLALGPGCARVTWRRISVSSLVLDPGALNLCPTEGALVRVARGRVSGGARIASSTLKGQIGSTPIDLAANSGELRLTDQGFLLQSVAARLGTGEDRTRLDLDRLTGRIARDGSLAGSFAGAAGKIANVPLIFSDGAADWQLAGGRLALNGVLDLDDAQRDNPRFERMHSDNFALNLADGKIRATGTLSAKAQGVKVADVTIDHDLNATRGSAVIDVPGIAFAPKGLQPDDLTQLTKGVIAAVKGSVSGSGRIDWTADGVTSNGVFRTAGTDLAAAFGPVTGLSGEIRFSDLLGLTSEPDQVVTLAEVNPGMAVQGGTIRYRLLPGQRVRIEGGEWPFAGGALTLDPTVLDFSQPAERHMTFRVKGVDAGLFLQEFNFDNLNATGTFDGVLPMVFDARGGRIEGGRLDVRESGGTIAYVGEISQKDVGFWGNFAFQSLKSLRYQSLYLEMNGPLDGEMITAIHFSGVGQGEGAKSNFLIRRIAKLPLVFNVTIRAPFQQLIDSVRSYYDPQRLIDRNLPELLKRQQQGGGATMPAPSPMPAPPGKPDAALPPGAVIQPPESENVQ